MGLKFQVIDYSVKLLRLRKKNSLSGMSVCGFDVTAS